MPTQTLTHGRTQLMEDKNSGGALAPLAPALALDRALPLTLDREADASARNPRCNIPINLDNWKDLPEDTVADLTWFHQHIIDLGLTNAEAAKALDYDFTVVYRALKGTYEGNWENIRKAIDRYRRDFRERSKIQNVEFVPNRNTKLIANALDYCVSSNTITLITGESGLSKSMATAHWRDQNNSGRTILITAPSICNQLTLLHTICKAIGRKANGRSAYHLVEHIEKALHRGRTLIIDEADFLLPKRGGFPICLETVRKLHDATKCGLAFIATARFGDHLRDTEYQFEQVLGRIGLACRLHRTLKKEDIIGIIEQYFQNATDWLIKASLAIANNQPVEYKEGRDSAPRCPDDGRDGRAAPSATVKIEIHGRLRTLVEMFRHASLVSHDERGKGRRKMTEQHFREALATRKQLMGEAAYAQH